MRYAEVNQCINDQIQHEITMRGHELDTKSLAVLTWIGMLGLLLVCAGKCKQFAGEMKTARNEKKKQSATEKTYLLSELTSAKQAREPIEAAPDVVIEIDIDEPENEADERAQRSRPARPC